MKAFHNDFLGQMDYSNPIMRWYNHAILKEAVKMAGLGPTGKALDFGCCETQELKYFLPFTYEYIGYDIVERWSDVKNYSSLEDVDVVFALNVLEHFFSFKKLQTTLKNFRRIGAKKVIVALPVENHLEEFARITLNKESEDFFAHTMPSKKWALALVKEFGMPFAKKRVNLLQILAGFKVD